MSKDCGLDSFFCPGTQSRQVCPLFRKKCPYNRSVQAVVEDIKITLTTEKNQDDRKKKK